MQDVRLLPPRTSVWPAVVDAAAGVCLIAGQTLAAFVLPPSWTVLGLFPPFWVGLVLLGFRSLTWGPPGVVKRWGAARPSRTTPVLLACALATRVAVLIIGLVASFTHPSRLAYHPRISENRVASLPGRWDAFWYFDIARSGYEWRAGHEKEQQNIAFFPAYPFTMRVGGDLVTIPAHLLDAPALFGGSDARLMWGGVCVSVAFFLVAIARLYQVALEDTGDAAAAARGCMLLATYPFALFFSVPYSESLALFALVSLVLAWRRAEPTRAFVWGLVFGLSRSNGWSVALALAADYVTTRVRHERFKRLWIAAAAPPLGAALYSAYVFHLTGSPLTWAMAQQAWGGTFRPVSFFTSPFTQIQREGFRAYWRHDPADLLSFVAVAAMIGVAVALARRRRWLYSVLIVAYLAPAVAIDLPAIGRLTALLFPAFLLAGARVKGVWFALAVAVFAVGQGWLAWRFFLWRTPY